jgi:hypothetical protein
MVGPFGLLAMLGCLSAGCATTDSAHFISAKPSGPPCQVVVTWNPQVVFNPDVVHGGAPTPALVGRLYLFGEEINYPLEGDGSVVVDLYDETPGPAAKPSTPLEEWRIDKDTLNRLKRRDPVGVGYTLILPWATYKPDISTIHLRLSYSPTKSKGFPLYADSAPLVLNRGSIAVTPSTQTRTILPSGQILSDSAQARR